MTNPSYHDMKVTRNASNLHGINIRLVYAPDMLWIGGVIYRVTEHTVREFRDPPFYEMVNVIRNCPDGNGVVPMQ